MGRRAVEKLSRWRAMREKMIARLMDNLKMNKGLLKGV